MFESVRVSRNIPAAGSAAAASGHNTLAGGVEDEDMVEHYNELIARGMICGRAKLLCCLAQHTLAQIVLLGFCFLVGGVFEFSLISVTVH